ncbi:uncharacterized protein LOC124944560 [Impatiens glandulifera]|uniref:uncharacterized protein LOC124944560 n=1 Tax=Impatiens glandulifera TaxID=253017 RepID=UPI001FB0ED77|nr:uncharacterized protein LOC124944560 [Impatiens glandulifera]
MEAAASSSKAFLLLLLVPSSQPISSSSSSLVHNCKLSTQKHQQQLLTNIRCTNSSNASSSFDSDGFPILGREAQTTIPEDKFPIEKRRRSEIVRERKSRVGGQLVKKEPPNFEIGWKRTKEIPMEVPTGYVIKDFLEKLVGLMDMEFGSTQLLAKTGEIVAERVREEAELLLEEGKVEERMVTELFRVLKLMEMDLTMLKASVKETTLSQRLQQAKARCRQAILVANSF